VERKLIEKPLKERKKEKEEGREKKWGENK
jgi:hypothetical protein